MPFSRDTLARLDRFSCARVAIALAHTAIEEGKPLSLDQLLTEAIEKCACDT